MRVVLLEAAPPICCWNTSKPSSSSISSLAGLSGSFIACLSNLNAVRLVTSLFTVGLHQLAQQGCAILPHHFQVDVSFSIFTPSPGFSSMAWRQWKRQDKAHGSQSWSHHLLLVPGISNFRGSPLKLKFHSHTFM